MPNGTFAPGEAPPQGRAFGHEVALPPRRQPPSPFALVPLLRGQAGNLRRFPVAAPGARRFSVPRTAQEMRTSGAPREHGAGLEAAVASRCRVSSPAARVSQERQERPPPPCRSMCSPPTPRRSPPVPRGLRCSATAGGSARQPPARPQRRCHAVGRSRTVLSPRQPMPGRHARGRIAGRSDYFSSTGRCLR